MWAHTGMVIKTEVGSYVLEAGRYTRNRRGVLTTPLKEWLKWNKGNTVAWRPYTGVDLNNNKIIKFLGVNKSAKEDMFVANWVWSMIKLRYRKYKYPHKSKYFCSQFIAHFMQELNIIKKKYDPSGYKPWELIYGDIPFNNGYGYDRTIVVEDPRRLVCKSNIQSDMLITSTA